ncbi:unnamed protein product [Ambrosiozyma monospora]|uniref:Unnamed protein product n=1 Tax=Ambrosiozyma monospora TaxID=43982 RepID=A0ACB5UAR0_AMBMO|nr:unnamed protein product [Ambrosiozyma monospora]
MEYARVMSGGTFLTQKKSSSSLNDTNSEGATTTTTVKDHTTTRNDEDENDEVDNEANENDNQLEEPKKFNKEDSQKNSLPVELPVKLPSPKRNKQLKHWPRLTGQASESQLKSSLMLTPPPQPRFTTKRKRIIEPDGDVSIEDVGQIGYDLRGSRFSKRSKRSATRTH